MFCPNCGTQNPDTAQTCSQVQLPPEGCGCAEVQGNDADDESARPAGRGRCPCTWSPGSDRRSAARGPAPGGPPRASNPGPARWARGNVEQAEGYDGGGRADGRLRERAGSGGRPARHGPRAPPAPEASATFSPPVPAAGRCQSARRHARRGRRGRSPPLSAGPREALRRLRLTAGRRRVVVSRDTAGRRVAAGIPAHGGESRVRRAAGIRSASGRAAAGAARAAALWWAAPARLRRRDRAAVWGAAAGRAAAGLRSSAARAATRLRASARPAAGVRPATAAAAAGLRTAAGISAAGARRVRSASRLRAAEPGTRAGHGAVRPATRSSGRRAGRYARLVGQQGPDAP